jgi:hypothetical protein
MRVCAKADNPQAMRFYESAGYSAYEVIFERAIF